LILQQTGAGRCQYLHLGFEFPASGYGSGPGRFNQMVKDFQATLARDAALGLEPDKIAFYDALAERWPARWGRQGRDDVPGERALSPACPVSHF